jgi:hypothetical protein
MAVRRPEGIALRHSRRCGSHGGSACSCRPSYQAQIWSAADRRPIRKTFPTLAEARAWRQEAGVALRGGRLRAPTKLTFAEAADAWLEAARAGTIRTRSGDRYKPSALRSYDQALTGRLLPALGRLKLSAVTRNTIQDLVDRLVAEGLAPSTLDGHSRPGRTAMACRPAGRPRHGPGPTQSPAAMA